MDEEFKDLDSHESLPSVLVVGDGDFSFSLAFTKHYRLRVVCTTIEEEEDMVKKYPSYISTVTELKSLGSQVITGVDATDLQQNFQRKKFSHIIFNFPHVGGKSNIKKNRNLLQEFFKSASQFLHDDGKIFMTLCKGQGGTAADEPRREWCNSWQVTAKAANSNLVLSNVKKVEEERVFGEYLCTGFRSQNKMFNVNGALIHIFVKSHHTLTPQTFSRTLCKFETIKKFCNTISTAWELEYTLDTSTSAPEVTKKQITDIPLYTVSAVFNLHDVGNMLRPIRYGNCILSVLDKAVYVQLVCGGDSVTNSHQVGVIIGNRLSIDILEVLTHLLDGTDVRYVYFDIYSVGFLISGPKNSFKVQSSPPTSIYPPEYSFDISFWLGKQFNVSDFVKLILEVCGNLVREVKRIDVYTDPVSGQLSHCYTVFYQSLDLALSYSVAYEYYQLLRAALGKVLDVQLR